MGKRQSLFVIAVAAACAAAPLASCLDATEIVIQLSTDVACPTVEGTHVLIRIGAPGNIDDNPPTRIESFACTPGDATASPSNDLGNVVVLPSSGFDSTVAISIALSVDTQHSTSTCFPETQGGSCIYAHRQISFLPHARVTLPIMLSSLCAGVSCKAPLTCGPDGKCTSGDIDPHDCGTQCSTGDDGGIFADAVIDDVPIISFDAPADVSKDAPADAPIVCGIGKILCNSQCIDPLTDKNNCGACGLDCSNGNCTNGTCQLDPIPDAATSTVSGTCLAIYNNNVWVSTSAGVAKIPTNGGTPSYASSSNAYTLASYPNALAWIEADSQTTIVDEVSANTYGQGNLGIAVLMAMSNKGYVWGDYSKGNLWVQAIGGGSPTSYASFVQGSVIPVAMADANVYWSDPSGKLSWATSSTTSKSVSVSSPGAVIVDDPTNKQPRVFAVITKNQIEEYDYQLVAGSAVATSTVTQLGALAYDGTTIYANGITEIQKVKGGSLMTVATTTKAQARCLAVDSTAVYWLEQGGGVFKHAK